MHKKRIYIVSICLLSILSAYSQEKYDFQTDTMTYNQYIRGEWEELYKTVTEANSNGVDFYYLNLRGAFASYYTKRYYKSVVFFRNAEKEANLNAIAKEIHYLAALNSGMKLETICTFDSLPESTQRKYLSPHPKAFESVSVESGFNFNCGFNELQTADVDGGYNIFGSRELLRNSIHSGLNLTNSLNRKVTLVQSLQYIIINKHSSFYGGPPVPAPVTNPTNPLPPPQFPGPRFKSATLLSNTAVESDFSINQIVYYANLNFNINDKFVLSPAFTYATYSSSYKSPVRYKDGTDLVYMLKDTSVRESQSFLSLKLSRTYNRAVISFSSNLMLSDYSNRIQNGIALTLYPLASKKLYTTGELYLKTNDNSNAEEKHIISGKIGYYFKTLLLEADYTTGNMKDFADNNGMYIYNTYETIKTRAGFSATVPVIQNKLWFSFYYKYLIYSSEFEYNTNSFITATEPFEHKNYSITGGLTWKF